jgi:hypothetical protein
MNNAEEIARTIGPMLEEGTDFLLLLVKRTPDGKFRSRVATNMERFDACCAMKQLVVAEEQENGPLPEATIDYVTGTRRAKPQ